MLNAIKNGVSLAIILGMALTYPACRIWPVALLWLIGGILAVVALGICAYANDASFAGLFTTLAFVALFGVAVGFLRVVGKTGNFWWSIGAFATTIVCYLLFSLFANLFNYEVRMDHEAEDTDDVDFEFEADDDDDDE